MHERHDIFVNMMTFDKTNVEYRRAVQAIFMNLFEEGKKRGFNKYRPRCFCCTTLTIMHIDDL
jgi:hypothetical protein